MTDKAVSALTSLTGANTATGDLVYIVDISEPSAADRSKKITAEELQNYMKKFPATIGVGNATPAASGAGITFPATASASSDANTLDDYEEGTPASLAISGSATAGTGTYTTNVSRYVKIGRQVTVCGYLVWSAHTGTGNILITGLPFASANVTSLYQAGTIGYLDGMTLTASNIPSIYLNYWNVTDISFAQMPVGGGASAPVPMDTAAAIIFAITYIAE
jgi:hypothetical protein